MQSQPPSIQQQHQQHQQEQRTTAALEMLLRKTVSTRSTVEELLAKLDQQEHLEWPSMLESYLNIVGQISQIANHIRAADGVDLNRLVAFPHQLSNQIDVELSNETNGRLPAIDHESATLYLSTQVDAAVHEENERLIQGVSQGGKADTVTKQISAFNKACTQAIDTVASRSVVGEEAGRALELGQGLLPERPPMPPGTSEGMMAGMGDGGMQQGQLIMQPPHMLRPGVPPMTMTQRMPMPTPQFITRAAGAPPPPGYAMGPR